MAGLPSSAVVEVEFVAGTWTDVTADWADEGASIRVGRGGEFDSLQGGTIALHLHNEAGNYTPDNPLSAYWPNVVENKRVRFSIVRGGVTYRRFLGYATDWQPTDLNDGTSAVTLTAVDALGRMGQRTMANEWLEAWISRAASETADVWPLNDAPSATSFQNAGSGVGKLAVATITSGAGSFQQQTMDSSLLLPGQVALTATSGAGPVLAVDLGRALGSNAVLEFAFKTSQQCTAASGDYVVATGYDASGAALFSLRLTWNGTSSSTDVDLFNEQSPGYLQWMLGAGGDGAWKACSVYDTGTQSVWFVNNGGGIFHSVRTNGLRYLVLGGHPATWQTVGKQSLCPDSVAFAGVAAASASTSDLMDHARPLVATAANTRLTELITRSCSLTMATSGTLIPQVTRTDTASRTALDCLDQVVQTIGGVAYHDYSADAVQVVYPDAARPTASSLTVVVGADDDARQQQLQMQRAVLSKPTRVTVSSAFGSATAIDTAAETGPPATRREESWTSCAPSVAAAYGLAGGRLNRSGAARFPQIPVDPVTAANDIWAALMGLHPGSRVTLSSLPSSRVGFTSRDCYAMGWAEVWTHDGGRFLLDTIAADAPGAEMRLDDAVYGRLSAGGTMTVTGGTAVTSTSNGTLIVTTGSGPTLTTDAAAYPLDLNYNGERVTIGSAPASSTSPQTVTTTARGVSPTVARAHTTREQVDVWLTPTIALI